MKISRRSLLVAAAGAAIATSSIMLYQASRPRGMEEAGRGMVVEPLTTGLGVPWSMTFISDDEAVVTERAGSIRLVDLSSGRSSLLGALEVAAVGEAGLLGVAHHASHSSGLKLFLYHTYNAGGELRNRVVRLDGLEIGDPEVILDGIPGAAIHDGGRIRIGPDGKLYATTGDAARPSLSQRLDSLGGKILRMNLDGSAPGDNPFRGSPILSYGHRNPQGIDWQPGTGRLYSTEHGPSGEQGASAHDELNLIKPGGNYGWPLVIGAGGRGGFIDPIYHSGDETWAPAGCSFYSGRLNEPWRGSLLFAALRGEHLQRVALSDDGEGVVHVERLLSGTFGRLRDVVEGPGGELYVLTSNMDGRGLPRLGDDKILRITWRR